MLETAYALIRLGARTDIPNANGLTALKCANNDDVNRAISGYSNHWRRRHFLMFLKSGGCLSDHKHFTELYFDMSGDYVYGSSPPVVASAETLEVVALFSKLKEGSRFDYQYAPGLWTTATIAGKYIKYNIAI